MTRLLLSVGVGLCGLLIGLGGCLGNKSGGRARSTYLPTREEKPALAFDDEADPSGVPAGKKNPPSGPLPPACAFERVEVDVEGNVRIDGSPAGRIRAKAAPELVVGLWERVGPCFLHVLADEGAKSHRVELPKDTPLSAALSVSATLVHAGFSSLELHSGDAVLAMRVSVLPEALGFGATVPVPRDRPPVPVQAVPAGLESPFNARRPKRVLLVRLEGAHWEFVWADQVGQDSTRKRLLLPRSMAAAELRERLAKECSNPQLTCKRIVLEAEPATSLETLSGLLNALPPRKDKAPLVEFAFLDQAITARMRAASVLAVELESGSVDQNAVVSQIQGQMPAVTACYQRGLERLPKLRGGMVLRFLLETDGSVSDVMDARVGSIPGAATLGSAEQQPMQGSVAYAAASKPAKGLLVDEGVASCVRGVFENLKLPRPKGGPVLVLYPLQLNPG